MFPFGFQCVACIELIYEIIDLYERVRLFELSKSGTSQLQIEPT